MTPPSPATPAQLQELLEFLRFPSVSTQAEYAGALRDCAGWLNKKFTAMGLESGVFETAGHPVVLARTAPDPGKRTVLIYGHYDVQPPDPLGEWSSPPFEPEVRDGRIFGRGSTDNKGQFFAHVAGVAAVLESGAALPVNLIFLAEGEEEIGSPNLPGFLREKRHLLECDVVVVSDTGMVEHGAPTLAYSLRGVAALECTVRGPSKDLHSGVYGGAVMNPLAAAARLIASLHDSDGRVSIPGFYDAVRPMAGWEREAAAALPVTDAAILEQTGSPALFGEPGYSSAERIGARPTAEVNGMGGGYQGEGTKTVLPREAFFKLTFRTVPDQKAAEVLDLAEAHLRAACPPGVTLDIRRGHSGEAYFLDPRTPDGEAARRSLEKVFGRPACLLREGGSIPILTEFRDTLGADCLLLALASPDCNAHSPDENFPLENFAKGIALNKILLEELAGVAPCLKKAGDFPPETTARIQGAC